jgi:hypothetical protein
MEMNNSSDEDNAPVIQLQKSIEALKQISSESTPATTQNDAKQTSNEKVKPTGDTPSSEGKTPK